MFTVGLSFLQIKHTLSRDITSLFVLNRLTFDHARAGRKMELVNHKIQALVVFKFCLVLRLTEIKLGLQPR